MKTLIAAAIAATLASGTAYAAESAFPAVEPAAIRVSTAGLDLSKAQDLATLQARVDKAIDKACTPHGSYFSTLAPERDCRALLREDTGQKMAALQQKAEQSRMAGFGD